MAYRVKQFRFYDEKSSVSNKNQPSSIEIDNTSVPVGIDHYVGGTVFKPSNNESCYPVLQLGVQALPGTKFYLNGAVEPIIVGQTGIYELELDKGVQITEIRIDRRSLELINNNANASLLIDVLYDSKEG